MRIVVGSRSALAKELDHRMSAIFVGRENPYGFQRWVQGVSLASFDGISATVDLVRDLLEQHSDDDRHDIVFLQGISTADWHDAAFVNLVSVGVLAEHFASYVAENKLRGSITMIGSASAYLGGKLPYAATKAALTGLMNALNSRFGTAVRTNMVVPGAFYGGMTTDWSASKVNAVASQTYAKRLADPREIVDAIIFLIDNEYVAGAIVNMSSGQVKIE